MAEAAAPATPRGRFLTARVLERTNLRASPGGRVLHRLGVRTESAPCRVLGVTARRDGWLAVVASERPNGRVGLDPGAARGAGEHELVHPRRPLRAPADAAPQGPRASAPSPSPSAARAPRPRPAASRSPTSSHPDAPGSPYGCCALALSGHQTKLIDGWPGGDHLAIHATPNVETVGKAASLGCMRARTGGTSSG